MGASYYVRFSTGGANIGAVAAKCIANCTRKERFCWKI